MGYRLLRLFLGHVRDNLGLYLFTFAFFALGVTAGALGVKSLNSNEQGELLTYLDVFLHNLSKWEINSTLVAQQAIFNNLKTIFYIWFLGLTVIGLPLILAIVFTRGFIMGFTVGFLVQEKQITGILLALFSILPQNLFNIPALIVGGVTAVSFSWWLVKGRTRGGARISQQFMAYSIVMLAMGILAVCAGLVEAYLAPWLMKLLVAYL